MSLRRGRGVAGATCVHVGIGRTGAGVLSGTERDGNKLIVLGCKRQNLTIWREKPVITSTSAAGIGNTRAFRIDRPHGQAVQKGKAWATYIRLGAGGRAVVRERAQASTAERASLGLRVR